MSCSRSVRSIALLSSFPGDALPARFGDSGRAIFLSRFRHEMVRHEVRAQLLEGVFGGVDPFQQAEILGLDRAPVGERVEIANRLPVLTAVQEDDELP